MCTSTYFFFDIVSRQTLSPEQYNQNDFFRYLYLWTGDWNLSEIIFTQNWNLLELQFVRTGICQNWNLSELEFVRIGICQNWNLSELEFVRISNYLIWGQKCYN